MKNQINKILDTLGAQGVAEGVFSGMSAGVSIGSKNSRFRSFTSAGKTRQDALGTTVSEQTLFDLASLTKPLSTVLLTLQLIGEQKLDWHTPLDRFLELNYPQVELYHLLNHSSGLPAYHPYFRQFAPRQDKEARQRLFGLIRSEPLIYETGSGSLYSDLGFILLGKLIEQCTGKDLDVLFKERIASPLSLEKDIFFHPIGGEQGPIEREVAASEACPWRGNILQGEVHDEHCWLMGGVAGHAGLFGSVKGVICLCEQILDLWKRESAQLPIESKILRYALQTKQPHSDWCLGFDTPTPGGSSSGRYFSSTSVGHLGFSGTSFWIDPVKEVIVVLLTNRIHPTRENTKIRSFRPLFHDRIMEIAIAR
ncbi:beta-lactamase family protein [Desulfobulbus rhabdoformis]|uniref:serine hydrolase domain-containing protein n=1 Tax=Desulfobulbus rhabdoformis TaxID=34032 RepID=UPI001966978E|nr:serine hydrolase domain-containing protein [Desulfobulbus rhabdoformis]MBM9613144.1 beta-lactamase family protein [Desulfobulbus rhabdoformis]